MKSLLKLIVLETFGLMGRNTGQRAVRAHF